ncbi:MAG: S-layer homology domain-containing protein [Clostridia bacterium]|nr:S-layer homology domain-containing protein [Clostridia bacterium]
MKRIICLLLTVVMLCSVLPVSVSAESYEHPFRDIKYDHWWYAAIAYCYQNNLLSGMTKTSFDPTRILTRAMFVQALANMEGVNKNYVRAEKTPFNDIHPNDWYYIAVEWARQKGIVSGMTANKFAPNSPLTRAQMATLFYNYAKFKGMDVSKSADLSRFYDYRNVPTWAKTGVSYCVAVGLMQGNANNRLTPADGATRAQLAQVMMNMHSLRTVGCVHQFGEWHVTAVPTVTSKGKMGNTCKKCSRYFYFSLPAIYFANSVTYKITRVDHSYKNSKGQIGIIHWYEKVTLDGSDNSIKAINADLNTKMNSFFSSNSDIKEEVEYANPNYPYTYTWSSSVVYNNKGYISIKGKSDWWMGGVSNVDIFGVTYNLNTGKVATLTELTGKDPYTLEYELASSAWRYLKNNRYGDYWSDAYSILQNYTLAEYNFYIQNGQIVLCFPTYELGPGASGSFEIPTGIYIK